MNKWMDSVAKSYMTAFCSYPGCCLPADLASTKSRDAPFPMYLTTQFNPWIGDGDRNDTLRQCAVSYYPFKVQSHHCPFLLPRALVAREIEFIHPLVQRNLEGIGLFMWEAVCFQESADFEMQLYF